MSKFSCIKETVIPAVVKRKIVSEIVSFSCLATLKIKKITEKCITLNTVDWNWDSVSLRELSDLALQLADILDENNKDNKDGWIPFVATKNTVCPVPPDTLVAIKTESIPDGTFFTNAKYWTWTDLNSDSNVIAYKVK